MEQAPKPTEAPAAKGKKTWVIVAAVAIIIIIVVAGLYFAGYLFPRSSANTVSVWENAGANCTTGSDCGFRLSPFNVTVGTTVTWRNDGSLPHTATSCSTDNSPSGTACPTMNTSTLPSFDVGGPGGLSGGQSGSFMFNTAGTYYYYCIIHPTMHGTIYVNPA